MHRYQPSGTATIIVLAQENPKQPGSRARNRFDLYKTGMTVQEFLDSGGLTADIYYDISRAYIAVSDYPYSEILSRLINRFYPPL